MNYPVAVSYRTIRKTRKDHRCCECGLVIPKGSACKIAEGLWEDGPDRYRWCLTCEVLKTTLMMSLDRWDMEDLCFGELRDWLREAWR